MNTKIETKNTNDNLELGLSNNNILLNEIKYDLDGMGGYENYSKDVTSGLTREQQLEKLPNNLKVHKSWIDDLLELEDESKDKDDFIETVNIQFQKCIEQSTSWLCIGFSYKYSSERFGSIEHTYEEPPFKDQMKELGKLI